MWNSNKIACIGGRYNLLEKNAILLENYRDIVIIRKMSEYHGTLGNWSEFFTIDDDMICTKSQFIIICGKDVSSLNNTISKHLMSQYFISLIIQDLYVYFVLTFSIF